MLALTNTPQTITKSTTPVDLLAAKRQVNIEIEDTADDQKLMDLIDVATELAESDTNSDIVDTENILEHVLQGSQWPQLIRIYCAPMRVFEKLEYKDADGNWQTLGADNYTVVKYHSYFSLLPTAKPTATALRFTFKTGYTQSGCPKKLIQAILIKVDQLYQPDSSFTDTTYRQLLTKHMRQSW